MTDYTEALDEELATLSSRIDTAEGGLTLAVTRIDKNQSDIAELQSKIDEPGQPPTGGASEKFTVGLPGSGASYEVTQGACEVAINQALKDASAFSGGVGGSVRLLAGQYITKGPIVLGDRNTLSGAGSPATNIVANVATWSGEAMILTPSGFAGARVTVENLQVDCRNKVGFGVYLRQDGAPVVLGPDPMHRVRGVDVFQAVSDGFRLGGARAGACREFHITDCRAQVCGGFGFNWADSSDGFIQFCSVQGCRGGGYNVAGGNSKVSCCKAYGIGKAGAPANAFQISSGRCTVTGCEAQDVIGNGFYVGGTNSSVSGCNADSCGDGTDPNNSAGFVIAGSRCYVSGVSYQRGNGGMKWELPSAGQMFAVRFAGGSNCVVSVVGGATIETYKGHVSGTPGSGSSVTVI